MIENEGTDFQIISYSENPIIFELRGYHVMLTAKVAEVFEV